MGERAGRLTFFLRQCDAPPMDGDIDSMQIEDAQGHLLTHLSSTGNNVVCKQKTPDYIWEVIVGP